MSDETHDLDLGQGHFLKFFGWHPDDLPGNRERFGVPLPSIEKAGASVWHPHKTTGEECLSAIHFDVPQLPPEVPARQRWQVESWDPLTISPSLLCTACGDHGFIRGGKWVSA